ncbi:hypothetical protein IFU00_01355 [Oxalobacteraceae sp. CFBP 8761]|nr:hypothetical protein [Oxalobacteraceae sp. CFBP 8761]
MNLLKATDAAALAAFANAYNYPHIAQCLEKVQEAASKGKSEYIQDAPGALVNIPLLTAGLTSLGYTVTNLNGTATPDGGDYVGDAYKVSW